MENLQARKRAYEILGKIMRGEDMGVSAQNLTPNNEMVELIEILTNNNPYFNMGVDPVEINYEKLLCLQLITMSMPLPLQVKDCKRAETLRKF